MDAITERLGLSLRLTDFLVISRFGTQLQHSHRLPLQFPPLTVTIVLPAAEQSTSIVEQRQPT
eukprot:2660916-Amphidinium_carterae.1